MRKALAAALRRAAAALEPSGGASSDRRAATAAANNAVPFTRPQPTHQAADAPPPAKKGRVATAADTPPAAKPPRRPPHTRFVALQLFYCGWNYRGLTSTGDGVDDGTVEAALFAALRRCRLIDPKAPRATLSYSRAGRTDARVSARGNVVALRLRSRVGDDDTPGHTPNDADEIDYVAVLNAALPPDVWVTGWAPVPDGFSARFSAAGRAYRYYWVEDGPLDVAAMRAAAAALIGTHDFRHLCKPDIPAVVNYVRTLTRLDVDEWPVAQSDASSPVAPPRQFTGVVLTVAGNAFLWHQIRCLAALLLMVGRGQEAPGAVAALVDVAATPRRPHYAPAPPEPLMLAGASFPGLVWRRSDRGLDAARRGVRALLRDATARAALLADAAAALDADAGDRAPPPARERGVKHVPLARRPCDPPLEERLAAKGRVIECGPPRRPATAAAGPA